jgi:hypothetical protein
LLLLVFFIGSFAQLMKSKTVKILAAFILLLCFTTGQVIIFTHSHVAAISKAASSKRPTSATADENCKICHLNHNSAALFNIELPNAVIYGTAYKQLQTASHNYKSISLILAATRGPPIA